MARAYLVFGDIEGKLDVLRVECTKCGRGGHYGVARLVEKQGREGSLMKWKRPAKRRLPQAGCADTRPVRPGLPICRGIVRRIESGFVVRFGSGGSGSMSSQGWSVAHSYLSIIALW